MARLQQLGAATALAAALMVASGCRWARVGPEAGRVYRIGWKGSAPYQVRGPDGEPTGWAVDLVREAARRRGITLSWVYWAGASGEALRGKSVDLWPLITISPERLNQFYISAPYLETEHCVMARSDGPIRSIGDLAGRTIETANPDVELPMLAKLAPAAQRVITRNNPDLLKDLCAEKVDAVFMDTYTGIGNLLPDRACGGHGLRWLEVPHIKAQLGIGATFENGGVADALRDEITELSREGKLAEIVGRWGFLSAQNMEPMMELIDSRRRERRLTAIVLVLGTLLAIGFRQTLRLARESKRARLAEQALRDVEQRLRLVANGIQEMVWAFGTDGKLIYANPGLTTLTGYTIKDLEREGIIDWFHPEDAEEMKRLRNAVAEGTPFENQEYRLITKDGAVKWVSAAWTPILDADGRRIGIQGSESDITTRKNAEEALRQSERRFRGLLENAQLAAAIFDRAGRFVFCNDFLLRSTGWEREEILGRPLVEFRAEEGTGRMARAADEWNGAGMPPNWNDEFVFKTKDGKRRWLTANNVAIYDAAGEPAGFACLGADTTEYRVLRDEYAQSQKLESIGRLAGGIAHDFNNLLTVIKGYGDLMSRQLREPDPLFNAATQIGKAAQQAENLTRQLLAFSRKREFDLKPVDVNGLIRANREMFARLLGDDVELAVELEPGLPKARADGDQLSHALLNLAINSRDAMPKGGKLTIATAMVEEPEGAKIRISVADTGSGIPEHLVSRIFDPFFTTKPEGQGTGLGLSMVYGTIQQCGGKISVRSALNAGTTFEIDLVPLPRATEIPANAPDRPGKLPRGAETVLVVEDRETVRQFTVKLLEHCGYLVLEAASGDHALRVSGSFQGKIDLLLTDFLLPGMTGDELAGRMMESRPEIKVIVMSGYGGNDGAFRMERDFTFLEKPFSAERLATAVRSTIGD